MFLKSQIPSVHQIELRKNIITFRNQKSLTSLSLQTLKFTKFRVHMILSENEEKITFLGKKIS